MPVASGTSILGSQTLLDNVTLVSLQMSIVLPGREAPVVRRFGYWYIYQYALAAPNQHYIVEEGVLRSPGVFQPIRLPTISSAFRHKLQVNWNLAGIAWTGALI